MTDREIKKLNRKELLELLVASERDNELLKERIRQQEAELQSRAVRIRKAGTMAEAALALNGVLESADKAAEQYLENLRRCSEQQSSVCDRIVSDAEQKAKAILDSAESESRRRIEAADEYWQSVSERLEAFYREHAGLQELLSLRLPQTGENK